MPEKRNMPIKLAMTAESGLFGHLREKGKVVKKNVNLFMK
jgi:hypothetical protein